jgi:hypothetical protein
MAGRNALRDYFWSLMISLFKENHPLKASSQEKKAY